MKRIVIVWGIVLISSGVSIIGANNKQDCHDIAQLITGQAQGGIPVTVDGELYIILTLENRIDPAGCKIVSNSKPTKVYVDK